MNPLNTLPVDQGILLEWYQDLLTARMLDQHLSSISNSTSFQGGELVPLICTEPLDPARDRYFPHGVSTATALARGVSAPNLMAGYLDRAQWNPPPDEDRLVDQAIHAGARDDGVIVVSLPDGPVLRTLTERGADNAIVVVVSSDSGADRHSDAVHVDGSDAIALVKAIREAVERTRRDRKLTTVVAMVAQIDGRRGPDGAEELGIWRQKDPLRNLRQLMIEERILSEDQESEITRRAEEATMVASASSRRAATGTGIQERRPAAVSERSETEGSVPAGGDDREPDEVAVGDTDLPSDSDHVEATETDAPGFRSDGPESDHPAGTISMGEVSTSPAADDRTSDAAALSFAEHSWHSPDVEDSGSREPAPPESQQFEPRPEEAPPHEPRSEVSPPSETPPDEGPPDEVQPDTPSRAKPPVDEPEAVEEEPAREDPIEAGSPQVDPAAIEPEAPSRTPTEFETPGVAESPTIALPSGAEQPAIAMDGSISMAGLRAVDSASGAAPREPDPSSTEPPSEIPRHPSREAPAEGVGAEGVGAEDVGGPSDDPVGPTRDATVSPADGVGQMPRSGTVAVQSGDELTVVFIGMEPTGISIPGGDILSVHRLSPIDLGPIVESIKRTSKPLIVTTPVTRSIGDNIAAHISEQLEEWLDSDVEHITVANPMSEASTIVKAASDLAEY